MWGKVSIQCTVFCMSILVYFTVKEAVIYFVCRFNTFYLLSENIGILVLLHFSQVWRNIPAKIENIQLFHNSFCFKNLYVLLKKLTLTCSTTFPICDSTGIAPKYFPLNFALGKMKCGLLSFTSTTFTLTCRRLIYWLEVL